MLQTVVRQQYTGNLAIDSSGCCNHGMLSNVQAGYPGFYFNVTDGRISIRPSVFLTQLECIRATVVFTLIPRGDPHRYNLLEGYLSFSLFINADGSISGTIVDVNGQWAGAVSAPNVVSSNTRHTAVLECDGINMVRVVLDGTVVAENYNVGGVVQDIGADGLVVGHWPDPPDQYSFEGAIFQVVLEKYDPVADLTRLLNPCCFDRDAVAAFLRGLHAKGVSSSKIISAGNALMAAARAAAAEGRGGDKTKTLKQQDLAQALTSALQRRDYSSMAVIEGQWLASAGLSETKRAALAQDINSAFQEFGLQAADWMHLLRLFCMFPCCGAEKGVRRGHRR